MKQMKRLLSASLALMLALFTLSAGLVVHAEDTAKLSSNSLWAGAPSYQHIDVEFTNLEDEYNAKLVSVKSSNTKVLKVKKDGSTMWDAKAYPLKAGKSKVTVTYKLNGKEQSVSGTVSVKNAPHPFQWVKVGGKKVDVSKADFEYDVLNWKKSSAKVEWKLKKNWTVDQGIYSSSDGKDGNFKSGQTVKIPNNGTTTIELHLDNQNGGGFNYTIQLFTGKAKLEKDTLWLGVKDAQYSVSCANLPYTAKVVSLKSSNKKAIKVKKGSTLSECVLTPQKEGKSKITVTMKINGKKKSFSATYAVKKYPDAITEIKVDGKAANLKKNKFLLECKATGDETKLEYTIGKGWTLKSCQYYDIEKEKYVTIKSGDSVHTKANENGDTVALVHFVLTNKDKDLFEYYVTFDR